MRKLIIIGFIFFFLFLLIFSSYTGLFFGVRESSELEEEGGLIDSSSPSKDKDKPKDKIKCKTIHINGVKRKLCLLAENVTIQSGNVSDFNYSIDKNLK